MMNISKHVTFDGFDFSTLTSVNTVYKCNNLMHKLSPSRTFTRIGNNNDNNNNNVNHRNVTMKRPTTHKKKEQIHLVKARSFTKTLITSRS